VCELSGEETRVNIRLPSNNSGKTSSGACNSAQIGCPVLYFVDPKEHVRSRQFIVTIMHS
jgi:hypothetical protein